MRTPEPQPVRTPVANPAPAIPPSAPATPAIEPTPAAVAPGAEVAGELAVLIQSTPPGAIIVVDGRPVGKAPVRVAIPATSLGFFQNYVEIRARFVAADETEISRTAVENFSPREKVPVELDFTPEGAHRIVR